MNFALNGAGIEIAIATLVAIAAASFVAAMLASSLRGSNSRAAMFILCALPLAALGIYLYLGKSFEADAPLAPRLEGTMEVLPLGAVVVKLEQHLRDAPQDVAALKALAALRHQMGAYEKSAIAWRELILVGQTNALHLSVSEEANIYTALAETLIEKEGGVIDAEATAALDAALALDPAHIAARFWRGVAWQQQGEDARTREIWSGLLADLTEDNPLAKILSQYLAQQE